MFKKLVMTAMVAAYCSPAQIFASAGTLDATFNPAGTPPGSVFTQVGTSDSAIRGIAIQTDGKIVATGYGSTGTSEFALARYNTNGTLDLSFGVGGTVTTPMGSTQGTAVVIQPNGKIVVAGFDSNASLFMVARFNTDGSLDTSFNGSGINITPLGDSDSVATTVALQPDGRIVAAGYATVGGVQQFVVARYTAAGVLDTSFNGVGYTLTPVGTTSSQAFGVALQSDGKIVVSGQALDGSNQEVAVARYTTVGVLDAAFGVGGIQKTSVGTNDSGNAIAIQPDGNIVVAGTATIGGTQEFLVQRYTTAGVLDATFGTAGSVTTPIGDFAAAYAVAIQQNGKIVAAGYGPFSDFALARYTADGVLDPSFNTTGTVSTPLSTQAQAAAMALQSDGKIVVGGFANVPNEFALARYFGDTIIPPTPTPTSNACALRLINKYGSRLLA